MDKDKKNKIICGITFFILLIIFGMMMYSIFSALNSLKKKDQSFRKVLEITYLG